MRVADIVRQLHFFAPFEHWPAIMDHLRIEAIGYFVAECRDVEPARAVWRVDFGEDRVEVEIVKMLRTAADLPQQFGASDHLVKAAIAKLSQYFADFFGDEGHQVDDLFRRAREFFAQRFILNTHTNRASVRMALAHHDAAHGNEA